MRPAVDEQAPADPGPAAAPPAPVGYYGKLPARGDFLTQRLAPAFVAAWDEWLRAGLAESQAALGAGWLDAYLAAPMWRFALPGALAGGAPVAGVMMPSVDRAGRYFPLTLAAALPADPTLALCFTAASWFAELEQMALRALDAADDFAAFDAAVAAAAPPPPVDVPQATPQDGGGLRLSLAAAAGEPMARLAAHAAALAYGGQAMFWTLGGVHVAPAALVVPALPAAARFVAFISDAAGRTGLDELLDGTR